MYKIIGGDQKVYGPVTGEQLRKWWSEGRLNTLTLVLVEGSNEWKPLGVIPEFAASITTVPPVVVPPPIAQQPASAPTAVSTPSVTVPAATPVSAPVALAMPVPAAPTVPTPVSTPSVSAPAEPVAVNVTPVAPSAPTPQVAPAPAPTPGVSSTFPPVPPPPSSPAAPVTPAAAPGPIPVVPPVQVVVTMPPKPVSQGNSAATAGFIFSIFSIIPCCCFTYIFAILGLIFSILGLNQAKKLPNEEGKNLAIAGIVICALALVFHSSLAIFTSTDQLRHLFPPHSF